MEVALACAQRSMRTGHVPVGAVITRKGSILAQAGNSEAIGVDPTAHAEIIALRRAAAFIGRPRLDDCTLYVTLEPCAMCASAMTHARIARVVYGADDPKGGAVRHGVRYFTSSDCHHRPQVNGGILAGPCGALLKDFFASRRV
ncbi:MAG: nucleoside deaminase [Pseudomonadota bacterium]